MFFESKLGRRARWYVLRSPLAPMLKRALRRGMRAEIAKRVRLAGTLTASPRTQEIATQLKSDGYAIVTEIIDADAMNRLAIAAASKLDQARERSISQRESHKTFWTRLLDEDFVDGKLPTSNPFVQFALQESVLELISAYYGELPRLDSVLLTWSRETKGPLAYSQLWHRDHDDPRVVKLFVYLTDVETEEDGPFTFIPAPISRLAGFSFKSRRTDADIARKIPGNAIRMLKAPRLSAFVVDTSRCLHMGSRMAPDHERLLYTATYIAVPRLYPEPPPRFSLVGNEDDIVHSVLHA